MIGLAELQGHWRRAWLRAPRLVDLDTCVHWMQCGRLYADIRIPAGRPDVRGATALADLSAGTLRALMRAEGFAGEFTVEDGTGVWHRRINWHGATEAIDAGLLEFNEDGTLSELGVYADYAELWRHSDDDALEGLEFDVGGRTAFLVTVGTRFVFGTGDPQAESSADLVAALEAGRKPEALSGFFSQVYVFGHWYRGAGMADLSTNPLLEGRKVLTRTEHGVTWHSVDFFGTARDQRLVPRAPCGAAA